jgi:hypothetical protein
MRDDVFAQDIPLIAFTMAELDEMRDDVFAQDIPLMDEMRFWTREAIDEYFRTGGEVRPVGVPVPPPVAPTSKAEPNLLLVPPSEPEEAVTTPTTTPTISTQDADTDVGYSL